MNKIGYIYGLVNPRTNIIFYIGKTIKPRTRLSNHLSKSNINKNSKCSQYLRELLESGTKPTLIILCTCKFENINRFEKKFITIHRKLNPNLTNERSGGDGWGLAKKLPASNWNKAIEVNKQKVVARNIKTGEETLFNSILECSEKTQVHKTTISSILNGTRNKSAKGFYFRKVGDSFIEPKNVTKFLRIDKDGNKIIFNSYTELKNNNYDPSVIYAVCNGKRKSAYGFKWEKAIE